MPTAIVRVPSFRARSSGRRRASTPNSSSARTPPKASSCRQNVGSANGHSHGSAAVDGWPGADSASIAKPSSFCTAPRSASCCESHVRKRDIRGQTPILAWRGPCDGSPPEYPHFYRPLSRSGASRQLVLQLRRLRRSTRECSCRRPQRFGGRASARSGRACRKTVRSQEARPLSKHASAVHDCGDRNGSHFHRHGYL